LGFQSAGADMAHQNMKDKVMVEVKKLFNPEFLNRVDEVVVFHSLERVHLEQIVDMIVGLLNKRMLEKNIKLVIAHEIKEFLIEKGYNPQMGARPLRRAVQRYLEDPIAERMLRGEIKEGYTVLTHPGNDSVEFEVKTEG